ncbi:hypothetical protein H0H93_005936, partial [Arthromyces matolae]
MFATLPTVAVPLSAINPSSPHSLPNIEVHTSEPQGTQLYPRGPPSKDCLMERATFKDPHLDGWIKVVNAELDKAKLNLQRTKKRFDK